MLVLDRPLNFGIRVNYVLDATYAPQGAVAGALMGYQSGGFGGITFAAA
jgi:hypothetical protein